MKKPFACCRLSIKAWQGSNRGQSVICLNTFAASCVYYSALQPNVVSKSAACVATAARANCPARTLTLSLHQCRNLAVCKRTSQSRSVLTFILFKSNATFFTSCLAFFFVASNLDAAGFFLKYTVSSY